MRQSILKAWKKLGMTRDDIGLIIDMDEVVSRDFLRATQMCDPGGNSWSSDPAVQKCGDPQLILSFPMFEGSPKCIHKGKKVQFGRFSSSSMVIGACIEGIGDSTVHPPVPRTNRDIHGNPQGGRKEGYGAYFDWSKMPEGDDGFFPLYNGADFRQMSASKIIYGGVGKFSVNFSNATFSFACMSTRIPQDLNKI